MLLLAQALLDEQDAAGSRETCERVLQLQPGHREGTLGLARALLAEGKTSPAAVRLEEALRRDSSFAAAHALLARVLLAEGNRAEAAEHYRRAVALDKNTLDQGLARELGTDDPPERPTRAALGVSGSGGRSNGTPG